MTAARSSRARPRSSATTTIAPGSYTIQVTISDPSWGTEDGFKEKVEVALMGVLAWITLLPLFGAGLVMLVPREEEAIHRGLGLLTALATFVVSLLILPDFDAAQAGFQLQVDKVWIAPLGIRFHLGIDGISLWLVLLTTFLLPRDAAVAAGDRHPQRARARVHRRDAGAGERA